MPHPLLNRRLLQDNQPLANMAWTGATWALDGSGRAYNVPTLGAELLTNGEFDSSTTGWTSASGATLASVAGGSSGNALSVTNGLSSVSWAWQSGATTAGAWVSVTFAHKNNPTAGIFRIATTFDGADVAAPSTYSDANWTTRTLTARALSASTFVRLATGAVVLGAATLYDSVSMRIASQLLATVAGTASDQTASSRIHALTTGTQAGVSALLDSASNPQNFLIAYHDGTNVRLDKCVAGTYTNLITTAVAFTSLAQIEIRRPSGNTFQLWYNGTQRGVDQTVSDAGIISNTLYGLFSTYDGNLFSEFSLGGVVIPFRLPGA